MTEEKQEGVIPFGNTPPMGPKDLKLVIAEQIYRFQFEKAALWEEKMQAVLNPRPRFCPVWFYRMAVKFVIRQDREIKPNPDAGRINDIVGKMPS